MGIQLDSVQKFLRKRPTLTWSFDTEFVLNSAAKWSQKDLQRLKYAVVSVELPTWRISSEKKSFGNFDYILPIYETGDRYISITFEETDDCLIQGKLLPYLLGYRPAWYNARNQIDISIITVSTYSHELSNTEPPIEMDEEYGYSFVSPIVDATDGRDGRHDVFNCELLSYSEPAYSHAGTLTGVTCTLRFLVKQQFVLPNDTSGIDLGKDAAADKAATKPSKLIAIDYESKALATYKNKEQFEKLKKEMQKELGTDKPSVVQVQQYLIKHGILGSKGMGLCATGVSLTLALAENADGYRSRGNGNTYAANGNNGKAATASDVEARIAAMKNNETIAVSFDMAGTNASGDSKKYGHVALISKDANGNVIVTSDFKQNTWRTYSDLTGANFRIMDVRT